MRVVVRPTARRVLTCVALAALLSGCTVVAVGAAVVNAGVTVASTAVDVGVATGKGVVYVGKAALGSDDEDEAPQK